MIYLIKVSVIIPAYNSEQFIAQTLESLMQQTLKETEIIVVNDGSTDSTKEIAENYAEKNDNIICYTIENNGVSNARNFGLSKASGEYVVFCDADDLLSKGALESFYVSAKENGADVSIGRLQTFNEERLGKFNPYADKLSQMKKIDTFDKTLLMNFLVGNKCYNRKWLLESGVRFPGFAYCEEGAFFMSVVYSGARLTGASNSISYYRRHTAQQGLSVSQTVSSELFMSFSGALNFIYEKAVQAVQSAPDTLDREDYLQEVIYKHAFVLLSQFYRLMWHGDDNCVTACADEFLRLKALMTEKTYNRLLLSEKDLHLDNIYKTKQQVSEKPNISVIVKKSFHTDLQQLFDGLYAQISPMFEVVVPLSLYNSGKIPEKYKGCVNLVAVDDENYSKKAKAAAKGEHIIKISSFKNWDIRLFRLMYKLPLPKKIVSAFFGPILKTLNFLLVKRIIK